MLYFTRDIFIPTYNKKLFFFEIIHFQKHNLSQINKYSKIFKLTRYNQILNYISIYI